MLRTARVFVWSGVAEPAKVRYQLIFTNISVCSSGQPKACNWGKKTKEELTKIGLCGCLS